MALTSKDLTDVEKNTPKPKSTPATRARKYAVLLVLMLQSSMLILTMRYSRMGDSNSQYFASTAVFLNELLKIAICVFVSSKDIGFQATINATFGKDHWKLAIPAALYVVQNNLQYVAASNLEAATFQVSYQLKILTTAFFSVILLKRQLRGTQWCALILLTLGVILVQLPDSFWTHALNLDDFVSSEPEPESKSLVGTRFVGLVAVAIACCLSGLAGVYFEKVLKHTESVSLWVRNIQLGFYSLFPAFFIGVLAHDGKAIAEKGFFYGYDASTVMVILLQAFGGILVALVVKYADNIMKNFATSVSIIVSAVVSYVLWGTTISSGFLVGATMVIGATFWFSKTDSK